MLYPWFMNIDTSPAKTLFWFPTDGGGGLPKGCEDILKKIDKPIAMSRFGQKQVKEYHGLDVKYIPHGLDTKNFYRISDEERDKIREKWGFKDKFVIGVVARNQPRKNLDRTIKAMTLIREKMPNAVLFLHMDPNDPAAQMFHIPSLIQKYNLEQIDISADYNESDPNQFKAVIKNQIVQCLNLLNEKSPTDADVLLTQLVDWCRRWDDVHDYNAIELYPELAQEFVTRGY
jgi:glycosyltransferase involved in cell wall biosynthesis